MDEIIVKLQRVGKGIGFVLPKKFVKKHNLKAGDTVVLSVTRKLGRASIVIEFPPCGKLKRLSVADTFEKIAAWGRKHAKRHNFDTSPESIVKVQHERRKHRVKPA